MFMWSFYSYYSYSNSHSLFKLFFQLLWRCFFTLEALHVNLLFYIFCCFRKYPLLMFVYWMKFRRKRPQGLVVAKSLHIHHYKCLSQLLCLWSGSTFHSLQRTVCGVISWLIWLLTKFIEGVCLPVGNMITLFLRLSQMVKAGPQTAPALLSPVSLMQDMAC